MPFASLGLGAELVQAAQRRGYSQPTPVQVAVIPAVLSGGDVLACAQTGSGKTAAFALPLLQRLSAQPRETPRRTQVLVLVPTRELAVQVGEVVAMLSQCLARPLKVITVFGGVSINPQLMALRGGTEVLVATPGRLLDLLAHNGVSLAGLASLVLDEADRLLDAGFADELAQVLAQAPAQRQHLLFSATFPPAVQALAEGLLHEPVRIDLPSTDASQAAIGQRAIEVDVAQRTPLLRHLIQQEGWRQVLVFVATQYACDHVAHKLREKGLAATGLHGDLSQGARLQALGDFRAGRVQVLVATDVAARGLDVALLPVVVNYDLPRSAVDYQHRIGRTGRAGASGLALSFISASTEAHFRLIEKRQGQRVPREQVPGFVPRDVATPAQAVGGVKGARKSKKDKLREAAAGEG